MTYNIKKCLTFKIVLHAHAIKKMKLSVFAKQFYKVIIHAESKTHNINQQNKINSKIKTEINHIYLKNNRHNISRKIITKGIRA